MTSVYNLIEKKEHKILGAQFRHWHTALVSAVSCTGVRTAVRDAPAIYAVVPNAQHAQEMATRRPRNRSPHVAKKEIRNSFLF